MTAWFTCIPKNQILQARISSRMSAILLVFYRECACILFFWRQEEHRITRPCFHQKISLLPKWEKVDTLASRERRGFRFPANHPLSSRRRTSPPNATARFFPDSRMPHVMRPPESVCIAALAACSCFCPCRLS